MCEQDSNIECEQVAIYRVCEQGGNIVVAIWRV